MINRKFRWMPPVLWGVLIAVLSLIPGSPGQFQFFGIPHVDKIGHFGMYAIWTFLFVIAFSDQPSISGKKAIWISIFIGTLTGVVLEFGQYYMKLGRMFEIMDMVANMLGASLGAWVGYQFYKWRKRTVLKTNEANRFPNLPH